MSYTIVVIIVTSLTITVYSYSNIIAKNNTIPMDKHMNVLKDVDIFLEHIQRKIRLGREILQSVDYNEILSSKKQSPGKDIHQPSPGEDIHWPSPGEDIHRPIPDKDIPQPSPNEDIHEPSPGEDIHPPSPGQDIHHPSPNKDIHRPLPGENIHKPSPGEDIQQPSPNEEIHQASPGEDIHRPSPGKDIHRPTPGEDIQQPSPNEDIHEPSPGEDIHQPSPGEDIYQPSPGEYIHQPPTGKFSKAEHYISSSKTTRVIVTRSTVAPTPLFRMAKTIQAHETSILEDNNDETGMLKDPSDRTTLSTRIIITDKLRVGREAEALYPNYYPPNKYVPDPKPDYTDIFKIPIIRNADEESEGNPEAVTEAIVEIWTHTASPGDVLLYNVAGAQKTHLMVNGNRRSWTSAIPGYSQVASYHTKLKNKTTPDPHPVLHHEMDAEISGYLSVGFENLCELITTKKPQHVREVMGNLEDVMVRKQSANHLYWMGQPMLAIFEQSVALATVMKMDEITSYALVFINMMRNRREMISSEVNYIVDYADDLLEPEDGEHLFDVLTEFRNYPINTTKTGYQLCEDLFLAFEMPYRILADKPEGKKLIIIANRAFKKRYPDITGTFRRLLQHKTKTRNILRRTSKLYKLPRSTTLIDHQGFNYEKILRRTKMENTVTRLTNRHFKIIPSLKPSTRKLLRPHKNIVTKILFKNSRYRVISNDKKTIKTFTNNPKKLNTIKLFAVNTTTTRKTKQINHITNKLYNKDQAMVKEYSIYTTQKGSKQKRFIIVKSALNRSQTIDNISDSIGNQKIIYKKQYVYTNNYDLTKGPTLRQFRSSNNSLNDHTYKNKNHERNTTQQIFLPHILNQHSSQRLTLQQLKNEIPHKITEISSYSDEEKYFKLHLMDHLIHYNKTYERRADNNTIFDKISLKANLYKAFNN